MGLSLSSRWRLNDGVDMPVLGLGTWQVREGAPVMRAVAHALKAGYRLIDTAALYANEKGVGEAVRASGIPREEIFVTTKVWNSDHGYRRALAAFEESNKRLGLGYVDLYLIHWPVEDRRAETWDALVELRRAGKARSIGVSNYTVRHLEELLAASKVAPAVNQVEFSPFLFQKELMGFCNDKGILLESYSPLTRGARLGDRALREIGGRHGRSPAQIIVRWNLQHGVVPIPKAARPEHIEENTRVFDFELSGEEVGALNSLDEGHRECWDPSSVG